MADQEAPTPETDSAPETASAPSESNAQIAPAHAEQVVPQSQPYQQFRKRRRRGLVIFLVILVLLAGAGGAIYWLYKHPKQPAASNTPATSTPTDAPATSQVKHFDSTNFNLALDYPADWATNETTDGKLLSVTSPAVKLTDGNNQSMTGKVQLTVQSKGTAVAGFSAGSAVAVKESEKIAYTKPTSNQRGSTYISFLHFANSTSPSTAIDAIYITGDNGYQLGQAITKDSFAPLDPLVGVNFTKCDTSQCANAKTTGVAAGSWDTNTALKQVKTILQSLAVN